MSLRKRILVVDDEESNRELLKALLESFGHEVVIAENGNEALAKLTSDIDLVLLDVMMPGMDGFEVAQRIRVETQAQELPIIMVTALTERADRLRAVEAGANDFIAKPINRTELQVRTASLLKMKEIQDTVKRYQEELEQKVEERTAELHRTLEEVVEARRKIYEAHLATIGRLVLAAEYRDQDTATHIQRISHYSERLAQALNLPSNEVETIRIASPMHDVGKLNIPDAILFKSGKLNENDWEVMKGHTTTGAHILSDSSSELLQAGTIIALSHHEKWDGSGYPHGMSGEEIPLWGRICAVGDVFDALTSKRPYKPAYPEQTALAMMKQVRGTHFDPDLFDLFNENFGRMVEIRREFSGSNGSTVTHVTD